MIIIMIISLREREREREVAQKGQQQIALDSSVLLDSNLPQSHQLQHQKAAVIVGVRGGKNRRREKNKQAASLTQFLSLFLVFIFLD